MRVLLSNQTNPLVLSLPSLPLSLSFFSHRCDRPFLFYWVCFDNGAGIKQRILQPPACLWPRVFLFCCPCLSLHPSNVKYLFTLRIAHHYCKKSANGLDEQLIEVLIACDDDIFCQRRRDGPKRDITKHTQQQMSMPKYICFCPLEVWFFVLLSRWLLHASRHAFRLRFLSFSPPTPCWVRNTPSPVLFLCFLPYAILLPIFFSLLSC